MIMSYDNMNVVDFLRIPPFWIQGDSGLSVTEHFQTATEGLLFRIILTTWHQCEVSAIPAPSVTAITYLLT